MMTLRTGNKAFTLFEVVVAVAILSLGILFVYEGFFVCLDLFDYCSNHLHAISWIDEKIWQTNDRLVRLGPKASIARNGSFVENNKAFSWNLSPSLIDSERGLYKINLSLIWNQGKRKINLKRIAYARYRQE